MVTDNSNKARESKPSEEPKTESERVASSVLRSSAQGRKTLLQL